MIENLSKGELEGVLEAIPVEISFVDKEDEVKYFNKEGKRIFPRTQAVIGRKVQQCHPSGIETATISDAWKLPRILQT